MKKAKTAKEVLVAAKWIIENVGWCQNAFAKDKNGQTIPPRVHNAENIACVCSLGALELVQANLSIKMAAEKILLDTINQKPRSFWRSVIEWNDTSSKEEVVKTFDEAIKMASGKK